MAHSILSQLKEMVVLLGINLKVKMGNLIELLRVMIRYYPTLRFLKIDTSLLFSYFLTNPFRLSKHFLIQRGEREVYTYGETPLTTLELITRECGLSNRDIVFELGCGRGRTCFWLNQFIGCSVVGIDYVPAFIEKAQSIKNYFHVQGVTFRLEDLFQADLKGATVIYLYGTCFSAASINLLIERFSQLPEGIKIITVSYALTEYQPDAPFQVLKQFMAPFTWGKTDVYLQVKKRIGKRKKNFP
jgi:SAM-dependent methyltransferase